MASEESKRWAKSCKCWRPLQTASLKPSDLSVSLPANNVPEQREKLAVLVATGKSKKALGAQLFHDQVKRFSDKGVDNFYKGYEARVSSNTAETLIQSLFWCLTLCQSG